MKQDGRDAEKDQGENNADDNARDDDQSRLRLEDSLTLQSLHMLCPRPAQVRFHSMITAAKS